MRKSGMIILWMAAAMAASCGGSQDIQPLDSSQAPPAHVEWLSPLPAGVQLNAVRMYDSSVGISVGELGTVVVTNDGGLTWSVTASGTQRAIKGVAFTQANCAVAVGEGGTLLRTEDGGQTWTAIPSNTSSELRAASFGTPDVGIIVGAGGVILRTGDGGRQWQAVASGVSVALRAAAFATPSIVVAVGDDGTLIRSTDTGLHWGRGTSGTTAALRGVQFINVMTGVAVGGDDLLWRSARVMLRTTDGGITWTKADAPGSGRLYGVADAGQGCMIAVGEKGATIRTSDAGQTWQAVAADKRAWLASVSAAGAASVAVGEGGKIFRSTDLGVTWTYLQQKPPTDIVYAVARVGEDGVVIGTAKAILRSSGGKGFGKTKTAANKIVFSICFLEPLAGIATGEAGMIQRTVDGGETWMAVESGTRRNLRAVAFSDERNGIAVAGPAGTGPGMVRTEDGGCTWHEQPCVRGTSICSSASPLFAVALLRSGVGMAAGGAGVVVKTTDGGRSWTRLNNDQTTANLQAIALLGANTAVAAGARGVILRTSDGGATWARRESGTPLQLNSLAFADGLRGLAVGAGGTILATEDGGLTWRSEPLRTTRDLRSVICDKSGEALITGDNGLVLRHTWVAAPQTPAVNAIR